MALHLGAAERADAVTEVAALLREAQAERSEPGSEAPSGFA